MINIIKLLYVKRENLAVIRILKDLCFLKKYMKKISIMLNANNLSVTYEDNKFKRGGLKVKKNTFLSHNIHCCELSTIRAQNGDDEDK